MVTQEETKQLNRQTSTIATFDRRIVSVALHKITILKNWKGKRDKWKCQAVRMFSINESYKNTLHLTAVWILIIPTARDSCLFVITEFKVAAFEITIKCDWGRAICESSNAVESTKDWKSVQLWPGVWRHERFILCLHQIMAIVPLREANVNLFPVAFTYRNHFTNCV